MEVIKKRTDELIPYARNSRTHSDEQVSQIMASIREFGFTNPILIDENDGIIAGHGRLIAAQRLKIEKVPCIVLDGLSETQKRAYVIADNKLALNAGWDEEMLKLEMEELLLEDFDLDLIGFSDDELLDLGIGIDETQVGGEYGDADAVPEIEEVPVIKPGDIIRLGDHILLCGDSGEKEDVQKLMQGEFADMSISDPPYGVAYVGKTKDALTIQNDDVSEEDLAKYVRKWYDGVDTALRPGGYILATVPPGPLHLIFAQDWKDRGWLRQVLVWVKDQFVMGRSEYHYRHEPILFGWKPGGERLRNDDRTRDSVWEFPRPKRSELHPTMKPVELWEYGIANHTKPGDIVYEPFSGSGTAIIACENSGRKCMAMEIDPKYAQASIQRWCEYTDIDEIEINGKKVSWSEYRNEKDS